jgi:hypothetical protein
VVLKSRLIAESVEARNRCASRASGVQYERAQKLSGALELKQSVKTGSKTKRWFLHFLVLFFIAAFSVAGQNNTTKPGSWSGILVSSACNADEAFAESPDCTKSIPGAKLALYDDTNRVLYGLEPQSALTAHLGDAVTVRGTLDDDAIRISSIELMSIGLAVGQKAPPFSLRDQAGRVQTLDTLKGTSGTVLLFFRSADW